MLLGSLELGACHLEETDFQEELYVPSWRSSPTLGPGTRCDQDRGRAPEAPGLPGACALGYLGVCSTV